MLVRGDGRLVLVRACGLWHQGFSKEGVGDIDKDVSYNHVLWFNTFLIRTQMDGKYCIPKINPSFFFPHKRRLHLHPIFLLRRWKYNRPPKLRTAKL